MKHMFAYKTKDGVARCFFPVDDKEFTLWTQQNPLRPGWVVYHENSCDWEAVNALPVLAQYGRYPTYETFFETHFFRCLDGGKMSRKQVRNFVSAKLRGERAGAGYLNEVSVYRNGKCLLSGSSLAEAYKILENGDIVEIKVFTLRGEYYLNTVSFQIINDNDIAPLQKRRDYRHYDPQKKHVYRFENQLDFQTPRLSKEEIVDLYDKIASDFGLSTRPHVVVSGALKRSSYNQGNLIKLALGWGQHKKIVLHELAHWLLSDGVEPHGKEFVGLYLHLLAKYCDVSLSYLQGMANDTGLVYANWQSAVRNK